MSIVYLDGDWLDEREARVSIRDRGFLHGDGVYETARLHRGGWFRLREHLDRLAGGARLMRIPIPPLDDLAAIADRLVRENGIAEGTLRITVTRGADGATLSAAAEPTVLATLHAISEARVRAAAAGWRVMTAATHRPPPDVLPPQLKGQGRIYATLARLEAEAAGVDDALLLAADGSVAEGPTWNVFWRRGRFLFTPSLEIGVLAGITRAVLLDLAPRTGYTLEEGRFARAELDDADEVFATMSSLGLVSFASLDGRELPLARATAARRLNELYWQGVAREIVPIA